MVLFGENGTGKSSVADAIDWVVRASTGAEGSAIGSLATRGRAGAVIEFGDGTWFGRGDFPDPGEPVSDLSGRRIHSAFRLGPVVLRRRDVVAFWTTPAPSRRSLCTRFLYRPETLPSVPSQRSIDEAEHSVQTTDQRLRMVAGLVERSHRLPRGKLGSREAIETFLAEASEEMMRAVGDASWRDVNLRDILPWDDLQQWDELQHLPAEITEAMVRDAVDALVGERLSRAGSSQSGNDPKHKEALKVLARNRARRALRQLEIALSASKQADAALRDVSRREALCGGWIAERDALLDQVLLRLNEMLGTAFLEIADLPHVEAIRVVMSGYEHLDLDVSIAGRRTSVPPVSLLSEANLDLLALFFLCASAEAAAELGQSRVLVLDDVLQSVDAEYRIRVARFLVERFRDWQLIFLTHDRLWAEELQRIIQLIQGRVVVRRIDRWSFFDGPVISSAEFDPAARVRAALLDSDPARIAWAAGLCLEEVCDALSWRLGISVKRQRQDRYTLAALWEPTAKRLRKLGLEAVVDRVGHHAQLRNLVGSHANEWAKNVSVREATDFAAAVLDLKDAVQCHECGGYVSEVTPRIVSCDQGCLVLG